MREHRLNPRQQEAVEYCSGPLLVLAGPGTGKTHVLTSKVAHLIEKAGLAPERILALTFTEKAAAEMISRGRESFFAGSSAACGSEKVGEKRLPTPFPLIATFHGFCHRLVEEFAERLGFGGPPRLLTGAFYLRFLLDVLDDVMETQNIDLVGRRVEAVRRLADFLSRCHDEDLLKRDLVPEADQWLAERPPAQRRTAAEVRDLAASLPRVLERQYAENIVSYGDLLSLVVRLCRDYADVRSRLQRRFDYILVDELQDNNTAQFEIVNALAEEHRRIFVVGDEDQCIYRFRGAGFGLVNRFRQLWEKRAGAWDARNNPGGFRIVALDENYRSTPEIIDVCQALIRQNSGRDPGKVLRAASSEGGRPISLVRLETEDAERQYVGNDVVRRLQAGTPPGDLAILCRSLGHVTMLVADLRRLGVAIEVVGEGGMFDDAVVRELIAWLRVLHEPEREEIALYRLLQSCGLSVDDQRALAQAARSAETTLMTLLAKLELPSEGELRISELVPRVLADFRRTYQPMRSKCDAASPPNLTALLNEILDVAGLRRRLEPESIAARQHRAAVQGLVALAEQYQANYPAATLGGFLGFLDLLEEYGRDDTVAEPSDDRGTVKVMTVHKAKGCEFPVVYVAGLLDHFPIRERREIYRKFLDHLVLGEADTDEVHLEEERRVLYVALSRARRELVLTLYEQSNDEPIKQPSPFVEELESAGVVTSVRELESGRVKESESGRVKELESGRVREWESGRVESRLLSHSPTLPLSHAGPVRLSASALETYAECPRRYYYRYVAGLPDPTHAVSSFGAAVRRTIKRLHSDRLPADLAHLQELVAILEEEMGQVPFQGVKEREQAHERGRDILAQYLREEAIRNAAVTATEVDKSFDVLIDDGLTLRGQWDRIDTLEDDRVRIVILKAGWLESRPEYLRGQRLHVQAFAARHELRKPLAVVEVVSLRELKILKGKTQIARWEFPWEDGSDIALTDERLDALRTEMKTTAQAIRAGAFKPIPEKDRCAACAFRQLCDRAWGTNEAISE